MQQSIETTPEFDAKYSLGDLLQGGRLSRVYRGTERSSARSVVVKFLNPDLAGVEDALQRISNEGEALSALQHPHIVEILDYGVCGELPYLVSNYVDGRSLGQALGQDGAFSVPEALRIFREVLQGLSAAHHRGIIHRDITPGNVLLDRTNRVRITDFGIARIGEGRGTRTGMMLGTPAFMAPEQALDPRVDVTADLYSAAALLFAMVTGEPPYVAANAMQVMIMHKTKPVPVASSLRQEVPDLVDQLIGIGMAKDPHARPPEANAYIRECVLVERLLAEAT